MGLYAINAVRYAAGEEPIRVRERPPVDRTSRDLHGGGRVDGIRARASVGVVAHVRTTFGENIDSLDVTCESGSYRLAPMNVYTGVKG